MDNKVQQFSIVDESMYNFVERQLNPVQQCQSEIKNTFIKQFDADVFVKRRVAFPFTQIKAEVRMQFRHHEKLIALPVLFGYLVINLQLMCVLDSFLPIVLAG